MVGWLATPLLVVGLGVDGVAIWSRVQARPTLFVTEVQTPNVLWIDVRAAKAKIVAAGLTPGAVVEVGPHEAPRGIVIGQGPGPGERVVLGFEMRLYVSKGPKPLNVPQEAKTVVVPKVIGLTLDKAEAVLADTRLNCVVRWVPVKDTPRGIVTGQAPEPGQRVAIADVVRVSVAEGPESKQ